MPHKDEKMRREYHRRYEQNRSRQPLIPDDEIRRLFSYCPTTGQIRSKHDNKTRGKRSSDGYLQVNIRGRLVMAHRLAWMLHHGEWPKKLIDHINGIPADNSISNLRLALPTENVANSKRRVDNKSGAKGVSYCATTKKWVAYLDFNGKRVLNKTCGTFDDAVQLRRAAAEHYFGHFAHAEEGL